MPDLSTNSEILIWWATSIGLFATTLVFLVSVAIFAVRAYFDRKDARARKVRALWQGVFMASFEVVPEKLPAVKDSDMVTVLVLWNYYQETFRDAAIDNLNEVAVRIGADEWSLKAIEKGSIRERLLAIQTLGWLGDNRAWFQMVEIMNHADPVTALCAAKAMLRINPLFGIEYFMPLVAERSDFNFATVGKLLRDLDAEIVTEPMIEEMRMREGEELGRLLRYIGLAFEERTAPVLEKLLLEAKDETVLIDCLKNISDPESLPIVRGLMKHSDWRVRTQAAACLGRIGTEDDIPRLAYAAGDLDWWVRFRAAKALAALPGIDNKALGLLADRHQNEFASEVITKVRLEMEAMR